MRRKKVEKVVFVDLPQLMNGGKKPNFYTLFENLREEFDEVKTYSTPSKGESLNALGVAASAGAFPIICPGDPDPIIVEEIRRLLDKRRGINEIAILSGDTGYFEVLETVKREGIKTKVILPYDNGSRLLKTIADEIASVEEYAPEYNPVSPWITERGSGKSIAERQEGVMFG